MRVRQQERFCLEFLFTSMRMHVRVCQGIYQHTLHHVPPDEFSHCPSIHQTRQAVKDHCLALTVGLKAAEQGDFHVIDHHGLIQGSLETDGKTGLEDSVGNAMKRQKKQQDEDLNSCAKKTKTSCEIKNNQ